MVDINEMMIIILCVIIIVGVVIFYVNAKRGLNEIAKRKNVKKWLNVKWANDQCGAEGFEITDTMLDSLKKAFVDILSVPFEKYKQNDNLLYCVGDKKLDLIANMYLKYVGIDHTVKPGELDYWDKRMGEICGAILIFHRKLAISLMGKRT